MSVSYDFFSIALFPVIIASDDGKVIYKNKHAMFYLPEIRCKSKVFRHMKSPSCDTFTDDVRFAEFISESPFSRAFIMRANMPDGKLIIFYFPSRLQFEDHLEIENFINSNFGGDYFCFLAAVNSGVNDNSPDRLYGELTGFITKHSDELSFNDELCDIESIFRPLLSKLSRLFCAIGLRIFSEISGDVHDNRFCMIKPFSALFFLCRAVYAAARCSSDMTLGIRISYSEPTNSVIIDTSTKSSANIEKGDITELAPECMFESMYISKCPELRRYFSISKDKSGYVHIRFYAPCVNRSMSLSLRNTYFGLSVNERLVRENVSEISSMLKKHQRNNNFAFSIDKREF